MSALELEFAPAEPAPLVPALAAATASRVSTGARCAVLSACVLWLSLLTLEVCSANHQRALELHERQRELLAQVAINQRMLFGAEAHVPGRLEGAPAQAPQAAPKNAPKSAPKSAPRAEPAALAKAGGARRSPIARDRAAREPVARALRARSGVL